MDNSLYIEEYFKFPPDKPKFPKIELTPHDLEHPELIKKDHRLLNYFSKLKIYEKELHVWKSELRQWKIDILKNKLQELNESNE